MACRHDFAGDTESEEVDADGAGGGDSGVSEERFNTEELAEVGEGAGADIGEEGGLEGDGQ